LRVSPVPGVSSRRALRASWKVPKTEIAAGLVLSLGHFGSPTAWAGTGQKVQLPPGLHLRYNPGHAKVNKGYTKKERTPGDRQGPSGRNADAACVDQFNRRVGNRSCRWVALRSHPPPGRVGAGGIAADEAAKPESSVEGLRPGRPANRCTRRFVGNP
jgi:hypothetical protein